MAVSTAVCCFCWELEMKRLTKVTIAAACSLTIIAAGVCFYGYDRLSSRWEIAESVDVVSFGAIGDGQTDCSTAFQQAIDSLSQGGFVRVPAGTYIIKNVVVKSNIQLVGEGEATVLKLPEDGTVWDMVLVTGGNERADNIVISDLTIDGSADAIGLRDVQMHGIDIAGGSSRIRIARVHFQNLCGDGIRITEDGNLKTIPRYIDVDECTFALIGRQDIAVVHGYDVTITNSTGTGTLDIEPEKPLVKRILVMNCTFGQLAAASKNDEASADIVVKGSTFELSLLWNVRGILVEDCEIKHMRVSTARDVTILNNRMNMLELFPSSGTITRDITITGNTIENVTTAGDRPIAGYSDHAGVGLYMWNVHNATVSNNLIRGEVMGIYISSGCEQTVIQDNIIEFVAGGFSPEYGLSSTSLTDSLHVTDNTFIGWEDGVWIAGSTDLTDRMNEHNRFMN